MADGYSAMLFSQCVLFTRRAKMEGISRRSAMRAATTGALVVGTTILGITASANEPMEPKLWPLEGELKIHPKYIYRYYLLFDGQKCALYGSDHSRDPKHLADLKLPVHVRVRGVLGTEHHPGGTEENPSPFPPAWTLYMDVHEVEALK
jgi:hypothetical protein